MKFKLKWSDLPVALLAILTASFACSWLINLSLGFSFFARAMLLGGLTAVSAALVLRAVQKNSRKEKAIHRFIEVMAQLDPRELSDNVPHEALPHLKVDNQWYEAAQKLHHRIQENCRRLEDVEHARAGSEVRVRNLEGEHERALGILTALPEPVLAIDDYDELVLTNSSAEELFEIGSVEQSDNRALGSLVRCETLVNLMTDTRKHRTQSQRTGDIVFVDDDGEAKYYRAICRNMFSKVEGEGEDEEPKSTGVVAILNDVSNEKAIQRRNAEFVSSVSHEMKTPLASIKAYVELLADGDAEDEETQDEFLEIINGQADRLQRLIENLLNIARIEAGVVKVKKKAQSLNEVLEEAFNVVQPAAEQKGIELVNAISSIYIGVLADRDMLMQVAINLLSNGIKYTSPRGTVTLKSRLDDDFHAAFEVVDTGVGLSPEDAARVFEKFYRVKKHSNMAPGTGLGLPLAKHITEDVHGGKLTVISELGEGSIFRATLPSAQELNKS
ncbi:MAG: two-component system phosphate regulon sensor histidine kinase PhoR [Pirellulaceae bacterium]|jgi:two-component system phosphate regulon sensor histidine kinase PhoR